MSLFRFGHTTWRRWAGETLEERDRPRDRREAQLLGVVALFVIANAVALNLAQGVGWHWPDLWLPAIWLAAVVVAHLCLRHLQPRRDPFLLPIFALLAGWGLLLQARLAPNFLGRQALWFVLSTAILVLVAVAPRSLQALMRYRYVLLLGGLLLLAMTLLLGVNPSGSGAALWLPVPLPFLGVVYFQPSELLKVLLVIFLASYFTEQEPLYRYRKQAARRSDGRQPSSITQRFRRHLPFIGPLVLMWGFCLLLLVWQQDLGAAALFFIVFMALLYLATGERVYVWSGLVLLLAAGVFAYYAFDAVVAPRVLTWLNPWPNVSDRAYQVVQSLYAQAAGGVFGRGIGQGFPDYIPVVHSDFALAAVAEEWGLLGSLTIVAAFAVLAMRGLKASLLSLQGLQPRFFHAYLAAGLVVLFSVQTVLIIGGVIKLLPLTGITLPFVSYGGSSLTVSSLMIGLLLFLSATNDRTTATHDRRLARRVERLGRVLLIAYAVLALTMTYWAVARSAVLAARTDNPRLVEAERRTQRGRILDRSRAVLAESVADGVVRRVYPLPESGPAVGYYSVRFGAAGAENALDPILRGQSGSIEDDIRHHILQTAPVGRDVQLTLDAALQQVATAELSGRLGGLVLLELDPENDSAAIRAMVSQPNYDPNRLDEQYEELAAVTPGALFNRAAQGQYQPGLILQPFVVAAALESGALELTDTVDDPYSPVMFDDHVLRCAAPRIDNAENGRYTWADMGRLRCPAPLLALGRQQGNVFLEETFERFGLTQAPPLIIPTAGGQAVDVSDPEMAAIGQERLTVTPLQAALAAAALAREGRPPLPRLVEAMRDPDGQWQPWPSPAGETGIGVSPEAAEAARAIWPASGDIAGFSASALSGPGGERVTWYLGFAPSGDPRYVLALVLENERDLAAAEAIGQAVLRAAD